jgi:hypothetical protein
VEGFDITTYARKYEPILRKLAIHNFVWSTDENDSITMADIHSMLEMYSDNQIKIHKKFPKQILFRVMQPYLYIYYLVTYGEFDYDPQCFYENLLETKLKIFIKANPCFGKQKFSSVLSSKPKFKWREDEKEDGKELNTVSFFTDTKVVFHSKHL